MSEKHAGRIDIKVIVLLEDIYLPSSYENSASSCLGRASVELVPCRGWLSLTSTGTARMLALAFALALAFYMIELISISTSPIFFR